MPRFHHVNLGVPPEAADAQAEFLVEILGYQRVPEEERPAGIGVRWFRADDGSEVHLSVDPEHRPAAKAHVAIHYGPDLPSVAERLERAGIDQRVLGRAGFPRTITCRDPAGNLWELRGELQEDAPEGP